MNDAKARKRVPVYIYRDPNGATTREWGTMTAIFALEGCDPIGRSARLVDPARLGANGFLPLGHTPDDDEE